MTSKDFTVTLKEQSVTVRCHRLAVHAGVVRFALLSGDPHDISKAQMLLCERGMVSCGGNTYQGIYLPSVYRKRIEPYRTEVLAMRDADRHYLWSGRGDELYQALLTLYTTPLLPEWMEWLEDALCRNGHMKPMLILGDDPSYYLDLTQTRLDEIVAEGLKHKRLTIPKES